uniref:RanBP2-type domain-containing protein n=1 Tax=Amorphochlora amoebiformis TaxID=1561963 RepID=A0A7S0H510_9EUKA|mmetsp:Transcript_4201/g.6383  ORF Transcript_4201/g.6383 Transcript_4201/m.6383 type:complete len:1109 (+) Transcript_4201:65-3391(+)
MDTEVSSPLVDNHLAEEEKVKRPSLHGRNMQNIHTSTEGAVADIVKNYIFSGCSSLSVSKGSIEHHETRVDCPYIAFVGDVPSNFHQAGKNVMRWGFDDTARPGYAFGRHGALGYLGVAAVVIEKRTYQEELRLREEYCASFYSSLVEEKSSIRSLCWKNYSKVDDDLTASPSPIPSPTSESSPNIPGIPFNPRDSKDITTGFLDSVSNGNLVMVFVAARRFDFEYEEQDIVENVKGVDWNDPKLQRRLRHSDNSGESKRRKANLPLLTTKKASIKELLSRMFIRRNLQIMLCGIEVTIAEWERVLYSMTEVIENIGNRSVRVIVGFRVDREPGQQQWQMASEVFFYVRNRLVCCKPLKAYLSLGTGSSDYGAGFTVVVDDEKGVLQTNMAGNKIVDTPFLLDLRHRVLPPVATQIYKLMTGHCKLNQVISKVADASPILPPFPCPRNTYILNRSGNLLLKKRASSCCDAVGYPFRSMKVKEEPDSGQENNTAPPTRSNDSVATTSHSRKRKPPRRFHDEQGNPRRKNDAAEDEPPTHRIRREGPSRRHPKCGEMRRELMAISKTIELECFREYWREWEDVGRPTEPEWDDTVARGRVEKEIAEWTKRLENSLNVRDFTQRLLELEDSMLPAYHTELWRGKKRAVKLWQKGVVAGRTRGQWIEFGRRIKKFKEWQEFKQEFDFYSCREAGQDVDARAWLSLHNPNDTSSDDTEDSPIIQASTREEKVPKPKEFFLPNPAKLKNLAVPAILPGHIPTRARVMARNGKNLTSSILKSSPLGAKTEVKTDADGSSTIGFGNDNPIGNLGTSLRAFLERRKLKPSRAFIKKKGPPGGGNLPDSMNPNLGLFHCYRNPKCSRPRGHPGYCKIAGSICDRTASCSKPSGHKGFCRTKHIILKRKTRRSTKPRIPYFRNPQRDGPVKTIITSTQNFSSLVPPPPPPFNPLNSLTCSSSFPSSLPLGPSFPQSLPSRPSIPIIPQVPLLGGLKARQDVMPTSSRPLHQREPMQARGLVSSQIPNGNRPVWVCGNCQKSNYIQDWECRNCHHARTRAEVTIHTGPRSDHGRKMHKENQRAPSPPPYSGNSPPPPYDSDGDEPGVGEAAAGPPESPRN